MAVTSTVRPLGLIRQLDIIIGGYTFQISAILLKLEAQGAYPLLLGRPWLWTTNINKIGGRIPSPFEKAKPRLEFRLKRR
mgnify:CR=1 FL=1